MESKTSDIEALVDEECYLIRDSGELPSIAYYSSVHYLTVDPEGPKALLTDAQVSLLQDTAVGRFTTIIIRDLTFENRTLSFYRGVSRAICNFQRLSVFCSQLKRNFDLVKGMIAEQLLRFAGDVICTGDAGGINCSEEELRQFAALLEVTLPEELWQKIRDHE